MRRQVTRLGRRGRIRRDPRMEIQLDSPVLLGKEIRNVRATAEVIAGGECDDIIAGARFNKRGSPCGDRIGGRASRHIGNLDLTVNPRRDVDSLYRILRWKLMSRIAWLGQ